VFQGLDDIPWSGLAHAYGSADDTPHLLRELASPDQKMVDNALYELYGSIWHQGTVYQATSYAVPFLLEVIQSPDMVDRAGVIQLLACIARGASYLDVHQRFSFFDEQRNTPEFAAEKERELAWVTRAHEAVGEGIDLYLSYLGDSSAAVRQTAAHALAAFPEHAERIVPPLLSAARREADSETGGILLVALGALLDGKPEAAGAVEDLCGKLSDERHRLGCAAALAVILRDRTPDVAIETLIAAFAQPEPRPYSEVPYRPVAQLGLLGRDRGVPALSRALVLTSDDDDDAHQIAHGLLALAFGGRRIEAEGAAWSKEPGGRRKIEYYGLKGEVEPVTSRSLDDTQHAALLALTASDAVWRVETNLLSLFGLPSQRESVAVLIL
jgi:hypothetical protein